MRVNVVPGLCVRVNVVPGLCEMVNLVPGFVCEGECSFKSVSDMMNVGVLADAVSDLCIMLM